MSANSDKMSDMIESTEQAQSAELTAGSGFTYEDRVAGVYLASLLTEAGAPSLDAYIVTRVSFQQSTFGHPLDDLIVDANANDDSATQLSLQIKRSLRIGAGVTNTDFRSVVTASWDTLTKPDFREGVDRYGCVVDTISADRLRALRTVCDWARASADATHFASRFATDGPASATHSQIKQAIESILVEHTGAKLDNAQLHRFLSHFVAIQLDALHEGETTSPLVAQQLQGVLADSESGRSQDLWEALLRLASENRGRAAALERPNLLLALKGRFRLRGSNALRSDIELVNTIARDWPEAIEGRICGVAVPRPKLRAALDESASSHRFVQVHGLPGTGKTAALKHLALDCLTAGPILFLTPDRLAGNSWQAFAQSIGLSCRDPKTLLAEIGALGTPYLFIDGIDRIESAQRNIITDLLYPILHSEALSDWRVVVTARDIGIEPLRNWLPAELFAMQGIGMVEVKPFDDDEAAALADNLPGLRPLLFSTPQVQQIARRPFFASVLARELASSEAISAPQSEVDLTERWWRGGGYNAPPSETLQRQRAIIDLARTACRQLGRPFALSRLKDATIDTLQALIADGIIEEVEEGHSAKFSHDIFFEWSFLHSLKDEEDWIRAIGEVGEPPVLGRVVELLSQLEFASEENWQSHLARIEASNLRSQWMRAWLLGPLSAADFNEHVEVFDRVVSSDNYRFLEKVLVWFQAERMRPNDYILSHNAATKDLCRNEIIRYADALGWPSDFTMWQQMLGWLFSRLDALPKALVPQILPVFEVWQNALRGIPNVISERIVEQSVTWLTSIEDAEYPHRFSMHFGEWSDVGRREALSGLASRLRSLVILSAESVPKVVGDYLARVTTQDRIHVEVYKDIVGFSATLAQTHPEQLAALAEAQLLKELPEDTHHRLRRKAQEHAEEMKRIRTKPESELTQLEQRRLDSPPSLSLIGGVSHWDWDHLAINDSSGAYFPASPLREPFHSLFQNSAETALRLTRRLCNHAITAWRQLHHLDYDRRGTPISSEFVFPWGTQIMWGGTKEYLWGRGWRGPQAIKCALHALDSWTFEQIKAGAEPDEVIRRLVEGHESVAPLAIAVCVALETQRISKTTLPLATNQRLWHADIQRWLNEQSGARSMLIGFRGTRSDRPHIEAVQQDFERPCRKMELRQLAQVFVLYEDDKLREAAQTAIQNFPNDLAFEYEEQRKNDAYAQQLRETADNWAEWGKPENYRSQKLPDEPNKQLVYLENPKSEEPKAVEAAQYHEQYLREMALFNWVTDTFEKGVVSTRMTIDEAWKTAKGIDHAQLFAQRDSGDISDMTRGAVAGAAAIAVCFPDESSDDFRSWAKDVVDRAYRTPEPDKDWFAGAIIPWHPLLFVAKALASQVSLEVASHEAAKRLLALTAHPLDLVCREATKQCLACWDSDRRLAWIGLDLGLRLCIRQRTLRGSGERSFDVQREQTERLDVAQDSIAAYLESSDYPELVTLPAPWELALQQRVNWFAEEDEGVDQEGDYAEMVWQDPHRYWDWDTAQEVLSLIPIDKLMQDAELRTKFLTLVDNLLDWTLERMNPSWQEDDPHGHDDRHTDLLQWIGQLSITLAYVCNHLSEKDATTRYLSRIYQLDDEQCLSFLSGFVDIFICLTVLDADEVSSNAIAILDSALTHVLRHRTFERRSYREGEVYGNDLPRIIPAFLFVHVPKADTAARFANGDWSEIEVVMPLVDKFIKTAGWVPSVAGDYITLVERAAEHYPPERFADQVIAIFEIEDLTRAGWTNTTLPARIAVMVQNLTEKKQSLDIGLAQKMLRILDFLVDMGDRRSAALQLSETFKNIKRDISLTDAA